MTDAPLDGAATLRRSLAIVNKLGLHARAAAKFVKLAGTFDAAIVVRKDGIEVPGDSIMGLMMLAAMPESEIEVAASGPEAAAALDALARLVADRFEED